MFKKCEWCEKEYEYKSSKSKYCSNSCKLKASRMRNRDVSKLKFDFYKIQDIKKKELNYTQRQCILGGLIGDGSINRNSNYLITHCEKQLPYLEYKITLMGELFQRKPKKYKNKTGFQYCIGTIKHPTFEELRKIVYPNDKIKIGDWINEIDELGLAIWYLDDGTYNKKHGGQCSLSTDAYSLEENETIRDFIENKFNIKASTTKYYDKRYDKTRYRTLFSRVEGEKLRDIVSKYTPECLKYKIK